MAKTSPAEKNIQKSRRTLFTVIGVVVVIILIILAIPYYQNYVAPFNRTVITVDDIEISMRYFLERARLANADPVSMLQTLTEEQVIKLEAPQYGIQATNADIDQELRRMAGGGTDEVSDVEFKEWYRQRLNNAKVSDSLYREVVRSKLLAQQLQAYLSERVPNVADQVHLHVIAVGTYEEAQEVEKRLQAGEDFASVAGEVSIDTNSKDNGGDIGWLPPSVSIFEEQIKSLDIGEISPPVPYYYNQSQMSSGTAMPDVYHILMISEKDSARPLDDKYREIIQGKALQLWLSEATPKHTIKYNFNSEIYAWMNWQLQKG
jgi:foldase protein PrsA